MTYTVSSGALNSTPTNQPNDIPYVSKTLAWTVLWNSVIAPDLDKINLIKELLSINFHKGQISLFCESEADFIIWFLHML